MSPENTAIIDDKFDQPSARPFDSNNKDSKSKTNFAQQSSSFILAANGIVNTSSPDVLQNESTKTIEEIGDKKVRPFDTISAS